MRNAVWCIALLFIGWTAAAQCHPVRGKSCQHDPNCGIIVNFNPPFDISKEDVLWLPNEITVDVPLELHPTEVRVASYPRGTGVEDAPYEDIAHMRRFEKVGNYARFRGQITKCPVLEDLQVSVYGKEFNNCPLVPFAVTMGCKETGSETKPYPPPTK